MYFRILIGISVLTFCLGDSSNHAISSISFHRDDVPLSYKYNYIHIYSTEKPINYQKPDIYRSLQYAPLTQNNDNKGKHGDLYTKAITSKWINVENVTKSELEPQIHSSGNNYQNRPFIAGYNIDVPKVNTARYTDINSEYNYDQHTTKDKHPINKLIFYKNAETNPLRNYESSQLNNFLVLNARKHQENPAKFVQVLSTMENAQIHPILNPYVKVPRLHINVARAYNIAATPVQAPTNGYQNFLKKYEQSHPKQIESPTLQKTYMYPLNKN